MSHATTYDQQSPNAKKQDYGTTTGRPILQLQPVDLTTWDDGKWADPIFSETRPDELDEPWPYRFRSDQSVWIRAGDGEWYHGKVIGRAKKGKTRYDDGLFWFVEFRMARNRIRKWFAPLNGDIKPDIENTHRLLTDAGWLESDSDE